MKKSIIYLGIFASMFINTSHAKAAQFDQQGIETEVSQTDLNIISENNLSKSTINLESEDKVIESIEVISSHYKKSIEEIIEDDKKITESSEELYMPLFIEPTIEYYIRLDNQIIESTISNDIYPIDFDLINQSNKMSHNFELKYKEALKS